MRPYFLAKRILDVSLSGLGLVVLAPVLVVAGVLVKAQDGGTIFFVQERVGRHGQRFRLVKIRSMSMDVRELVQTYDRSPQVTGIGTVLRRTKLDEAPQLWNVVKGDMSIVGPRQMVPTTVNRMPPWAHVGFDVRPGLTGLAQTNGNAAIPWEARWRYDEYYVAHSSMILDLSILLRTFRTVLRGEASQVGPA